MKRLLPERRGWNLDCLFRAGFAYQWSAALAKERLSIVCTTNRGHFRRVMDSGLVGVPREQKMLKGHLPSVM